MDETKIIQYFEGKTILITGASGFLAKIFMEKILRVQPNVKKLFLLLRATPDKSVEERLNEEILNIELFRVLRERYGDLNFLRWKKVIPVEGDVSKEDLGIIDSNLRHEIVEEIDIIVNSAATTNFEERYDIALGINAFGVMQVQNFARKCSKVEMLLHVSTAFVQANSEGLIVEKPLRMGETLAGAEIPYLNINKEKKIVEETLKHLETQKASEKEITGVMKDLGVQRAMLHGWPNTYVFTKAMGEMVLDNFNDKAKKVIIIRPSIIASTHKEPFPGWIEGVRTFDTLFVGYGKGLLKFFVGDPESTPDLIPGDMVVDSMLAAIATNSNQASGQLLIYHVGSSRRNPVKFAYIKWLMYRYLIANPLLDNKGRPIKVGKPTTLNSMSSFQKHIATRYVPFVKVLGFVNLLLCNHFESLYKNARRRVNRTLRLAELYKPYLFFQGIFDDVNIETLRVMTREGMVEGLLNFDPKCIQWEAYLNTHFLGVTKYALK